MSIDAVTKKIRNRYRKRVSKSTVHRWIRDSSELRSVSRFRKETSSIDDLILIRDLLHTGMIFRFSVNRFKLENSGMDDLGKYLLEFQDRPEFQEGNRCSSLRVGIDVSVEGRHCL